jgi:hypothetical protein
MGLKMGLYLDLKSGKRCWKTSHVASVSLAQYVIKLWRNS